jgi:hypothetical protein
MIITDEDIWKPLTEQKWRELAEATGASELQLRFSAARFGGASATKAAKLAGYAGDDSALRRAGYSAVSQPPFGTFLNSRPFMLQPTQGFLQKKLMPRWRR